MTEKNLKTKNLKILLKFPKPIKKVLVIGLGAGGILALRNLKKININNQINIKCYELSKNVGGFWNFDDNVNLTNHTKFSDNTQSNFTTPMYDGLTTNIPAKLMAINDVPDIKCEEVYPKRQVILNYLNDLVDVDNLKEFVTFETKVLRVAYLNESKEWKVNSLNMSTMEETEELFDCVVDCSSFYNANYIPNWSGLDDFNKKYPNKLIHSRYYRKVSEFKDSTVVIVGKGPSAMNIAQELSYEQCTIIQSSRPIPIHKLGDIFLPHAPNNPKNLPTFVSPIASFKIDTNSKETDKDFIILEDGSNIHIPDYIISATGYKFEFNTLPNTSPDLLQPTNSQIIINNNNIKNMVLRSLYKLNPTFMAIGMATITSLIPLWDYQTHLIANTISMVNYFHETSDYKPLLELIGDNWIFDNKNEDEFIMNRAILLERYSYLINLSLRINIAYAVLPNEFRESFPIALINPPSNEWLEEATIYSLGLPPYNRE